MKANLFIVEDEMPIVTLLKYNLEKEGHKVNYALNGEDAIRSIKDQNPDLILLDWMLPDISGIEVCRNLKRINLLKNIPIIMLTAKGEEEDKLKGFKTGADDYVTKPFSVRELILRVKVILKKQKESSQNGGIINIGPISINHDAHEVKIHDQEVILTALEFKLLNHLLRRKGRVQTRDQLLGDVWGYSSEVTTRTVDTHIKRLREKLGTTGDLIQTIRGVGYRFNNIS